MPQRPSLRASLAFIAVSAPLAVWLLWRRRRLECSPALGARKDSGKAEPKNPEQARRRPPKERAKPADSSDDDDDEPTDERQAWLWQKMEGVLKEYSLSPLVMVAARKWLRQMAEPSRTDLARLRDWMVLRVNGKLRAPPLSSWQSGCPEILPGLRANPVWEASGLEWLRPFEENAAAIREELLALRSGRGFQPLKIPNWASKNKLASPDGSGSVSHDAGDWNGGAPCRLPPPARPREATARGAGFSLKGTACRPRPKRAGPRVARPAAAPIPRSRLALGPAPRRVSSQACFTGAVFYLFLHEVPFPENCSRCPLTTKLLKALGPRSYQHAFFSALTPGTHIIKARRLVPPSKRSPRRLPPSSCCLLPAACCLLPRRLLRASRSPMPPTVSTRRGRLPPTVPARARLLTAAPRPASSPQHHGPTNKKLRIHLPLVGAAGSSMRVADTLLRGEEGKCLVFDDSFEHEAWHEGDATRIVLVFDVWHPDLTDREVGKLGPTARPPGPHWRRRCAATHRCHRPELARLCARASNGAQVQFFSMLQRSRMRAEMQHEKALRRQEEEAAAAAAAEGREPSVVLEKGDNFYQLLQDAKDLLPDNQWWVQ